MDWNAIINGVLAQSPIAGVLLLMWWKADKRADKWADMYVKDSRAMTTALSTAVEALKK